MSHGYEVYVEGHVGVASDNLWPVREDGRRLHGDADIKTFNDRAGLTNAVKEAVAFCAEKGHPIESGSLIAVRCVGGGIGLFKATEETVTTTKVERAVIRA